MHSSTSVILYSSGTAKHVGNNVSSVLYRMKEKHKSWSLKKRKREKAVVSTRLFAGLTYAYIEKSFEDKLMNG